MRRREKFPRVDDKHRAQKVETARRWIFTKGVRIGADSIRDLLQSLTPTRVWHNIYDTLTVNAFTEHFFTTFRATWDQFLLFIRGRSAARV
jgi:hypothetical protein